MPFFSASSKPLPRCDSTTFDGSNFPIPLVPLGICHSNFDSPAPSQTWPKKPSKVLHVRQVAKRTREWNAAKSKSTSAFHIPLFSFMGTSEDRYTMPKSWQSVPYLPSGSVKIAIENGHRNSGFFQEKWRFSIVMLVYQRVIVTIVLS